MPRAHGPAHVPAIGATSIWLSTWPLPVCRGLQSLLPPYRCTGILCSTGPFRWGGRPDLSRRNATRLVVRAASLWTMLAGRLMARYSLIACALGLWALCFHWPVAPAPRRWPAQRGSRGETMVFRTCAVDKAACFPPQPRRAGRTACWRHSVLARGDQCRTQPLLASTTPPVISWAGALVILLLAPFISARSRPCGLVLPRPDARSG